MRARGKQIPCQVMAPAMTRDDYGQAERTYTDVQKIAAAFRSGSGSKSEYAEAQQGTQSYTLQTRYLRDFELTLEHRIRNLESGAVYRITSLDDRNLLHDSFFIDAEEVEV